jgi:hypothetical protein
MGRNTVASYANALRKAGLLDGDPGDLPDLTQLLEAVDKEKGLPQLPRQQRSSIERLLPIIDAKYADGVPPTAIYDFLRLEHEDFAGRLSAVKHRCAALRHARGIRPEDVTMPVETDPVAQVDFGYAGKLYDPEAAKEKKAWDLRHDARLQPAHGRAHRLRPEGRDLAAPAHRVLRRTRWRAENDRPRQPQGPLCQGSCRLVFDEDPGAPADAQHR